MTIRDHELEFAHAVRFGRFLDAEKQLDLFQSEHGETSGVITEWIREERANIRGRVRSERMKEWREGLFRKGMRA